jgi:uncharacterized membrane protein
MVDTTERLRRLRTWFAAYFVFQSIVGTWSAAIVVQSMSNSNLLPMRSLHDFSAGFVIISSLVVCLLIFGVALVLFHQLLQRKNWARVTMLAIAWLSALSAGASLLSSRVMLSSSGWLERLMPDMSWGSLFLTSNITNLASLIYSIYMIRTLQFNQQVRAEFLPPEQP